MSKEYYKQSERKDRFAVYEDDHCKHRGKAEYAEDGHMIRLDVISPSSNYPGRHVHEWWNEKEGYGYGLHEDHKTDSD